MESPRNKKVGGPPPSAMPQPGQKRTSLRYSLNHLGKALADVVGKESKAATTHVRSASAIPVGSVADRSVTPNTAGARPISRRPSVAGAFDPVATPASAPTSRAPSQAQNHVRTRTISTTTRGLAQLKSMANSPKRASPSRLASTITAAAVTATSGALPVPRRSLMPKGLTAPTTTTATVTSPPAAPVPVGTAKVSIRPKVAASSRPSPTEDVRPNEVKERRTDSPRGIPATVGRALERTESRPSPVRSGSALPTPKGRASPTRNDQTPTPQPPKDDREKRRERREREKQAADEKERERKEAKEREKEAKEREKEAKAREKEAKAREKEAKGRTKQTAPPVVQPPSAPAHRTSSSTTTLASSIFTSVSRSSTGDSHSSKGSNKLPPPTKSSTAVFPRAAQTIVLTPPDDEEEDEDITIQTPMTRSRTATGSTTFGDISSPAISRTLLASISAQTESPIMAPLDHRLRRAGSVTSLNSSLPSPVHPSTVAFPPPAAGFVGSKAANKDDDEEWDEEGDVSALLETVISPLKGQATPAMPRFAPKAKSKTSARSRMPETPSRGGLPSREALSYPSPAIPDSVQRAQPNRPRESILSWDALVERSRLEEGELEDMLRAPPPAVGLISPDMRPARNLPRLTNFGPKRMNLAGISDSEPEIEEETVHGQTISQVLFQQPAAPVSPVREKKASRTQRELAEKEKLWTAREEAWQKERAEWEAERAQWEAERSQWGVQQTQWHAQRTQWNTQQAEWSGQQAQVESQRAKWETERATWAAREHELTVAVQARDDDLEALEQESSARTADLERRAQEHEREVEALMKQVEAYKLQSQDLRMVREREARMRCTNAWTNVHASLKADADACAADRAALKVILMGLEAMVRV